MVYSFSNELAQKSNVTKPFALVTYRGSPAKINIVEKD